MKSDLIKFSIPFVTVTTVSGFMTTRTMMGWLFTIGCYFLGASIIVLLHLYSHKIAHLFGWNFGRPIFWRAKSGTNMTGFKCDTCGKISSISPSVFQD